MALRETRWRPPSRKRWTPADGRSLLRAIEASGLDDAEFAREHVVARHRIDYWRKRLSSNHGAPARKAGFAAVPVGVSRPRAESRAQVEIALGGARRLVFRGPWTAVELAPWLEALELTS